MSVVTGRDAHGADCSVIIRENGLVSCISDRMMQHRFIGLVQDTETAVDVHSEKRLVLQEEENDFDKCIASLVNDRRVLSISNILHQQFHRVCTLTTQWIYANPDTDIVNNRRIYYMIFDVDSHPFNKAEMLTDLMQKMDRLTTNHP